MGKKNIFDVIEGYYLANVLMHLNRRGFFNGPSRKKLIGAYFPDRIIYRFVKDRTDIIQWADEKYCTVNPAYSAYPEMGFHIEKFLEAYGTFDFTRRKPAIVIDENKFAKAFAKASPFQNHNRTLHLLGMLGAKTVLDLGCGTGSLLVSFCHAHKQHRAFGIDQNPYLQRVARARVAENNLAKRARVIKGNVMDFPRLLPAKDIAAVDAIYCASLLNAFFESPGGVVKFLKKLKKSFAGKYLVVVDYYGILNTAKANDKTLGHNYVHDIMQVLSGQGLPPANKKQWNEYYVKAGCTLLYAYENKGGGIKWFIHIVKLG